MFETMSRRRAILAALSFPAMVVPCVTGCSGEVPNQRVSGTMVVPLESVEKADEIAAKKLEASRKAKGKNSKR